MDASSIGNSGAASMPSNGGARALGAGDAISSASSGQHKGPGALCTANLHIREVWEDNLEAEFALIREVVEAYPCIGMDTEFPGTVARPVGSFKSAGEFYYQTLRNNVDMLKLIQLGLTFSDENGNLPSLGTDEYFVWQFNFREFRVDEDMFAQESIELLKQSGIDFDVMATRGIDLAHFGELLISSGIVLDPDRTWLTFHSGYDFGYLLKALICQPLPQTEYEFFELLRLYFPVFYDMKYLMKYCDLHGGLSRVAEVLDVERIGPQHQAGSDSLITTMTFVKMKNEYFLDFVEDAQDETTMVETHTQHANVLFGLGSDGGAEWANGTMAPASALANESQYFPPRF